jgi:Leucine-rich repeat (LRR) protein
LFVAALSSAVAQDVTIQCTFQISIFNEYACRLEAIEVLDPTANVIIAGNHLPNRTNDDVLVVQIRASNTPFMIQQLFTAFPNIYELDIHQSNLQSINVPRSVQLIWLVLYRNNISRIEGGTFDGQNSLNYLELEGNGITELDENAFVGLQRLSALILIDNLIEVVLPRTFHPLRDLTYLEFERNRLTSIRDIFVTNTNLYSIYLNQNQINDISPEFAASLRTNLRFLNLDRNLCVDNAFLINVENDWSLLDNALQACRSNFVREEVTLECDFRETIFGEYACRLRGITVLEPSANITVTGTHLEGRTNADIEVIQVWESDTPFVIQELLTAFPNVVELDIELSNLQVINIPETVQLQWLILYENNIHRIEAGSIRGQESLSYLELISNRIRFIDELAFDDCERLGSLILINNLLEEIHPRTLAPLTGLTYLDFERNRLASIAENNFVAQTRLSSLYLEFNQINQIHPSFQSNVVGSINFINLSGNRCVSRSFSISTDVGVQLMTNFLQTCYNNFPGTVPVERDTVLAHTGNLAIFDQWNNLLARA